MTPEIVSDLRARLRSAPRPVEELHQVARAAGSTWTIDQVALLLACLPDASEKGGMWHLQAASPPDRLAEALFSVATTTPLPATALLGRLPGGLVVSAAALCEAASRHAELELLPGNRIRRRCCDIGGFHGFSWYERFLHAQRC